MVKKFMRPLCGSTLGGSPVAPCSALCHRGNPPVVQPLEKAEHFLYLDGFSLDGTAPFTKVCSSSTSCPTFCFVRKICGLVRFPGIGGDSALFQGIPGALN